MDLLTYLLETTKAVNRLRTVVKEAAKDVASSSAEIADNLHGIATGEQALRRLASSIETGRGR